METTFKERLEIESQELFNKMIKLEEFIGGNNIKNIPQIQQSLLIVQFDAMRTYQACLTERIKNL